MVANFHLSVSGPQRVPPEGERTFQCVVQRRPAALTTHSARIHDRLSWSSQHSTLPRRSSSPAWLLWATRRRPAAGWLPYSAVLRSSLASPSPSAPISTTCTKQHPAERDLCRPATERTAEDQVRIMAEEHTKQNVGRPNGSIDAYGRGGTATDADTTRPRRGARNGQGTISRCGRLRFVAASFRITVPLTTVRFSSA